MKKFVPILLAMLCCTCATKVSSDKLVEQADTIYRIDSIDSVNSFYIIYALKDNQKYKIVSKKDDIKGCKKIVVGKDYKFNLESILAEKIKLGDKEFSSSNSLTVDCFSFDDNTEICKEQSKGIHDLHKTKDLVGLCYSAPRN
jgi:2-hydroxy-3-keto-5-methylthiopentenyl-1-phosphate phosphatase